jgi:AraC-like DNA-binding protein
MQVPHGNRRWPAAALAAEAGVSRSGLAARFGESVGDGQIEYLTCRRTLLPGRSLSRSEPVGAIAHALGYESE